MFGIMLLTALTVMNLYVLGRAFSVPALTRRVPRRWLVAAGAGLWALSLFGVLYGRGSGGPLGAAFELFGMDYLASLFLTTLCLLAVEVVTLFGLILRRLAPMLRGWALVAGLLLSIVAVVQGVRPPVVTNLQVRLPGLPAKLDGTVVVALSDLHLGTLTGPRWLAARVSQVEALHPDLILLLGDIVEGHGRPPSDFTPVLRRFSAPMGVWAVTGNHEHYGRGSGATRCLEEAGATVLHDRWAEVRPGLILAGVDDLTVRRRLGPLAEFVGKALAGRPPGATLFLSHTPWGAEAAAAAGAGLLLSAHTHGGQIWPFGYLVRLSYPLFEGRYVVNGMTVYVTRGAGTWGPKMRLWPPGEILRITLKSGS
ncbi:MAG: metallophosphoesterase [Acidobacteriota bacterium]